MKVVGVGACQASSYEGAFCRVKVVGVGGTQVGKAPTASGAGGAGL